MTIATLCNRTVDIERATLTRDAQGGRVETWAVHLPAQPIRIQPRSASERAIGGNPTNEAVTHKGYMPGWRDVKAKDRLTGRHPQSGEAEVFIVRGEHMTDHDGRLHVLELEEQR